MADWKPQIGDFVVYIGIEMDRSPKIGSVGVIIKIEAGTNFCVVQYDGQPNVSGVNGKGLWTTGQDSIRPPRDPTCDYGGIKKRIEGLEIERDKIDKEIRSLTDLLPQEPVGPAIRHLDLDD